MLTRVRAKNLLPGGKSLSGDRKHSPVVQVRVSEHTRDKLQAIAKARGMSVSKLSRKVLDEVCRTRDSWVIYACFGISWCSRPRSQGLRRSRASGCRQVGQVG